MLRRVLDRALSQIDYARASDWLKLLELPRLALDWSSADQQKLDQEFKQYYEGGVTDERYGASSVEELEAMRDSLGQLTKETGVDFTSEVERLEEKIAEKTPPDESERDDVPFSRMHNSVVESVTTDDDVRSMFQTLHDDG